MKLKVYYSTMDWIKLGCWSNHHLIVLIKFNNKTEASHRQQSNTIIRTYKWNKRMSEVGITMRISNDIRFFKEEEENQEVPTCWCSQVLWKLILIKLGRNCSLELVHALVPFCTQNSANFDRRIHDQRNYEDWCLTHKDDASGSSSSSNHSSLALHG